MYKLTNNIKDGNPKFNTSKLAVQHPSPSVVFRLARTCTFPCMNGTGLPYLLGVIFHSSNERSHWIKDNISNANLNNSILLKNTNLNNSILLQNPNLNNSILLQNPNLNNSMLLKNTNLNNSIVLKGVSYCYFYCWNDQWNTCISLLE